MSVELLSSLAAMALSLAAAYLPGFSTRYRALPGEAKRLLMAGMLLAVAAGALGLACAGWSAAAGIEVTCDAPGAWMLTRAFVAALIANQAAYTLAVRPDDAGKRLDDPWG